MQLVIASNENQLRLHALSAWESVQVAETPYKTLLKALFHQPPVQMYASVLISASTRPVTSALQTHTAVAEAESS